MKAPVTKFDLEQAFKALEDIETPEAPKGIKANRPIIKEAFSTKTCMDVLMEDYYNIDTKEGLEDALDARADDIAAAKLARIEKIVDLDAKSADELLPSYVGKYIIQCPQCMTLFYKDKEDIEPDEADPEIVNVAEVCQHCGNDSGYTVIGKVGAVEEEADEESSDEVSDVDEAPAEEVEETEEEVVATEEEVASEEESEGDAEEKENSEDDLGFDTDIDLDAFVEPEDEEKKEESLNISELPNKKNTSENDSENLTLNECAETDESVNISELPNKKNTSENDSENLSLNESPDLSDAEIDELLNSDEYETPVSEDEIDQIVNECSEKPVKKLSEALECVEDIDDEAIVCALKKLLNDDAASIELTGCELTVDEDGGEKFTICGKLCHDDTADDIDCVFNAVECPEENACVLTGTQNNMPVQLKAVVDNGCLSASDLCYC